MKVDFATMVFTALPKGGFTALMLAARQGALNGVRALAEAGADLDATDPDGTTALDHGDHERALRRSRPLLVEKGAEPRTSAMTPG